LVLRLYEFNLLPEKYRKIFVNKIIEYAVDGEDLYGLYNARIQAIFSDDEYNDLRDRVQEELIPKLEDIRYDKQSDFDKDGSAEEHMETLLDIYKTLKKEYGENTEIKKVIDNEIKLTKEWIDENENSRSGPKPRNKIGNIQKTQEFDGQRSIFDDIDT
jgi:hypothetical protein